MLIPNITRTWAPKGQTPLVHYLYKQDRISAISTLTVSPRRKRLALYIQFRTRNLTGLDVRAFLQDLLRHVKGPLVLLWDRGTIHRRKEVTQWRSKHPRLQVEYFPAYAPELNPVEYIWGHLKTHEIGNLIANKAWELGLAATAALRRMRRRKCIVAACYTQAELWP